MNKVLIKAAILASILFVILEQLDGFISVPLREISTWLSYTFLKMASFPVDKQGTLLSTPRMTFDVIPACSGSTTMRVMIFVGVLWAGMQEKMSMSKKLLLTFTVIPIAIVANSLRLCALVSMGYMLYKPVEGFLHDLTGMAAFVLAFGAFLGISMFFQSDEQIESKKSNSQKISLGILTIVTLLCYTPLFSWCLIGWNSSPLDKYGFIFPIFALSCIAYTWIKTTKTKTNKRWLILLTVATLITMTISVVAEVNILAAISFSFLILTGLNLCHGPKMLFISLPLVAMGFLGSPTVTFMINKLFLSIGLKVNTSYGIAIKVCLSLILLCAWFYLIKKKSKPTEAISYQFSSVYTNTLIGALCILLGIKSFYHNNLPTSEDPGEIKVSYILGDWIGKNINNINDSNTYKKKQDTWIRFYQKDEDFVKLIVTASGGDRHQLHPPEYCLTGAGWNLNNEKKFDYLFKDKTWPITEMDLSKEDEKRYFLHWFTDGNRIYPSYKSMLTEDTIRRFKGERTKWFLFRLIGSTRPSLTDDFLKDFHGSIRIDEETFNF